MNIKALASTFSDQGYLHLPQFIDPSEGQKLIMRMRDLVARSCPEHKDHLFQSGENSQSMDEYFLKSAKNISFFFDKNCPHSRFMSPKEKMAALNKVGHALHSLCPVFRKFSHDQRFYDLAREVGAQKPELIQSMFIFKQAHFGDEVLPHQDSTYMYTSPESLLGLWFAFEDATVDNGCLWVMPGGHKLGLGTRYLKKNGTFRFETQTRVNWPLEAFKPVEVKAGDAILLHGLVPHLSKPNFSHRTRFAYTLHFIDAKSHYSKNNWLEK